MGEKKVCDQFDMAYIQNEKQNQTTKFRSRFPKLIVESETTPTTDSFQENSVAFQLGAGCSKQLCCNLYCRRRNDGNYVRYYNFW